MLIDLAHVTVRVMNQVLDMSEAPVIFSHSSAYSLCKHSRNVPDEVLLKVVSCPSANSPLLSRPMLDFIVYSNCVRKTGLLSYLALYNSAMVFYEWKTITNVND